MQQSGVNRAHMQIAGVHGFCYHHSMAKGIIDLRKPTPVQSSTFDALPMESMAEKDAAHASISLPTQENAEGFDLKWSAYEHEHRIRSRYWFLYPLAIATFAIVFGIVTHDYLFIMFIVISFAILTYYARRTPRLFTYAIEKRGVWIENKLIDFAKLKSFWIFRHSVMVSELLLETDHPVRSITHIRLENISPDVVRNVMSRYLPEKEQKDLASDQIARIIGF